MEDLRHQLLQAELKRIEDRAEANSFAIMNKADALFAAHQLCQRINAAEPGVCEFSPSIVYHDAKNGCSILIYTRNDGDVFLRRCIAAGLAYEVTGASYEDFNAVSVDGFKGVEVAIRTTFIARREILDAAAA